MTNQCCFYVVILFVGSVLGNIIFLEVNIKDFS